MSERPLNRAQVRDLADQITSLLADPDAGLTAATRARWEGALTALAYVLGDLNRLPVDDPSHFYL